MQNDFTKKYMPWIGHIIQGIDCVAKDREKAHSEIALVAQEILDGDVVELVDTLDLGSSAAMREGSSPSVPTIKE